MSEVAGRGLERSSRPRPGVVWRLAALWVGPALLVVAAVLPAALLAGRLPRFEEPPYRHPMDVAGGAGLAGFGLGAAWAALVIVYLSLRAAGRSRENVWRLGVPLLYFGGGLAVAWANTFIAINLDQPYARPPDSASAAGLLIDYVAGLLVAAAGVLLGRQAADSDRVPRPRPVSRTIWICEVQPSASWWLVRGVLPLALVLFFAGSFGLAGVARAGLVSGLVVGGFQVLLVLLASTAQFVLTPDGIRVRHGHFGLLTSVTTMDQIESIEVTTVRLPKLRAAWFGGTQLVLRDGPALVVRTRWGERRWFTLPEADEAAALLRTWLAQRQAAVRASHARGGAR